MVKKIVSNTIYAIIVPTLIIILCIAPIVIVVILFQEPPHECIEYQISIIGDEGLATNEYITGLGTKEDPYVLENLELNTGKKCSLLIENITKYLVIRNCFFTSQYSVFTIRNSLNGTITLYNNRFDWIHAPPYGFTGIEINSAPGINITKNNFRSNHANIFNCSFATITMNSFYSSSLEISSSTKYIISSNIFQSKYGDYLFLSYSSNSSVEDNSFITLSNEWYDSPLLCYHSENITINNNYFKGPFDSNVIVLDEMKNFTISNNIILEGYCGIYCYDSFNGIICGNNISNNSRNGVKFDECDYINITKNEFSYQKENAINIHLYRYEGNCCFIFQNNFLGNNVNGNYIGSYFSSRQVYDKLGNTWYNPDTHLGNYWDDLVWYEGCYYMIDGGNSTDPYPLQHPVDI